MNWKRKLVRFLTAPIIVMFDYAKGADLPSWKTYWRWVKGEI